MRRSHHSIAAADLIRWDWAGRLSQRHTAALFSFQFDGPQYAVRAVRRLQISFSSLSATGPLTGSVPGSHPASHSCKIL